MTTNTVDALYRAAYRMAYPVWRFYLRQFRTRTQGAQVAVWNNDRVLLIRNSYRETYAFPGGYIRNGENTAAAASRELCEETGISVPTGQLRFSFAWSYTCGKLEGHDDIYECQLENEPGICIDNREVIEARFVTPDTALALPLERHVRHYLEAEEIGYLSTHATTFK
jgi:8-oxo-dGTP pyrophosphatase MutT (NUDIX family)